MDNYGEKIKAHRRKLGITQQVVADAIGISQVAYANIENENTTNISINSAKKIAKKLNVAFSELFEVDVKNDDFEKKMDIVLKKNNELHEALKKTENELSKLKFDQYVLRGHFSIIFVYNIQVSLSNAKSDTGKKMLIDVFNKDYMLYKKDKCIDESYIKEIITGKEHAYKEFIDWYNQLKGNYTNEQPD